MFLRVRRPVRRLLAWAVLALYALPSTTALAAELVHGVQHAAVAAAQARRQAVAVGLAHRDAPVDPGGAPEDRGAQEAPADAPLIHTHDGTTHAHGPWVAALDRAADADHSSSEPATADGPTLSPHLATLRVASTGPAAHVAFHSPLRGPTSAVPGGPVSPPPRG